MTAIIVSAATWKRDQMLAKLIITGPNGFTELPADPSCAILDKNSLVLSTVRINSRKSTTFNLISFHFVLSFTFHASDGR